MVINPVIQSNGDYLYTLGLYMLEPSVSFFCESCHVCAQIVRRGPRVSGGARILRLSVT
jgi:hypothetical protein